MNGFYGNICDNCSNATLDKADDVSDTAGVLRCLRVCSFAFSFQSPFLIFSFIFILLFRLQADRGLVWSSAHCLKSSNGKMECCDVVVVIAIVAVYYIYIRVMIIALVKDAIIHNKTVLFTS